jgi:hypothetical protein
MKSALQEVRNHGGFAVLAQAKRACNCDKSINPLYMGRVVAFTTLGV